MQRSLYVSFRYTIASAGQNIGLIIAVVAIIVMELAAYKGFHRYKGPGCNNYIIAVLPTIV